MIANYGYWISTTLLSLIYLVSATLYIFKRNWVRKVFAGLGYPEYLVPLLIAVKLLVVAVILSRFSVALSDLAYAGMFYHLLLSAAAHIGVRKPRDALPAVLCLVLLMGVSLLSLGIFTQPELAGLKNPSMAPVLEKVVGSKPRIERVAADLVAHFEERNQAQHGKAMRAIARSACTGNSRPPRSTSTASCTLAGRP